MTTIVISLVFMSWLIVNTIWNISGLIRRPHNLSEREVAAHILSVASMIGLFLMYMEFCSGS